MIGLRHIWIPGFLGRRNIAADALGKWIARLKPAARFIDRFLGPRLTFLTEGPFFYILAAAIVLIALVTPVVELMPFAGIVPNAAMAAFALAITARDGVWALIAFGFTAGVAWLILTTLL